ncbi:MAG: tryptophan 2,3-dioxygenase family protein [Planctomycetota bacterium]|nr:tryptophan 2,3-dioxygenase family protein [Planctomycetota bacterium]
MNHSDSNDHPAGCPMGWGTEGPSVFGKLDLDYNTYLRIPDLLQLQHPLSDPPHHDEMLFIIIHQTYELWFKLILGEIEKSMLRMSEKRILPARNLLNRTVEILRLLVGQIHILETMTPQDFLQFRDGLFPASGFQSLQFRELEFLAGAKDERYLKHFEKDPVMYEALKKRQSEPDLRGAYYELLRNLGFPLPDNTERNHIENSESDREKLLMALRPIYSQSESHLPLYLLTESLIEFDEYLGLWRYHHVRVVERIIGYKRGSGGSSGVGYLLTTTDKRCFPSLWEVRTYLEKQT